MWPKKVKIISIFPILLMPFIVHAAQIESLKGVAIVMIDAFLIAEEKAKQNLDTRDIARDWAPENLSDEIKQMRKILFKANEIQIPVFEFYNQGGYPTNPKLLSLHQKGNWTSLGKNSYSIFTDPRTQENFREQKISKIIVMGFNQKLCVRESIIDARSLGYEVYTSFEIIQGHKIESDNLVKEFYQQNTVLMSVDSLLELFLD